MEVIPTLRNWIQPNLNLTRINFISCMKFSEFENFKDLKVQKIRNGSVTEW
jgi:hypothetical protein